MFCEAVLSFAIGSSIPDMADIGDTYEFSLKLELPQASDEATLSVLVTGTNPVTETSSVKLCSPSVETVVHPQIILFYKSYFVAKHKSC